MFFNFIFNDSKIISNQSLRHAKFKSQIDDNVIKVLIKFLHSLRTIEDKI